MLCALAFVGLSLVGPPELPPDIGDVPPAEQPPPDDPIVEDPVAEDPPPSEPPDAGEDVGAPEEPPAEPEAIPVTPEPEATPEPPPEPEPEPEPTPEPEATPDPPEPEAVAPPVQSPSTAPTPAPAPPPAVPTSGTIEPETTEAQPEAEQASEEEEEEESYRKLGGTRLFRIGLGARIGYTHGTSAKNGLYDRDKSIQDSINNMDPTVSGAGDLGATKFGGFQYGFILDAEVVGINVWLDFHKFFRPGGMWSLLLGYDHEFGFGKRVRLDVGVGGGLNHVFLGSALSNLYYDKDNPESVNIGTLGVEGRAMVDLHIKLVGPLYTGPYALLGYHYLWSANAAEVTAEKGLHYSAGWSLRLDFGAPKLIGGRKKK